MERKMSKTIKTGKQQVRATFEPSTFDAEKRTVEVVWSTGAKGKRGYYNPYFEELSMQKVILEWTDLMQVHQY